MEHSCEKQSLLVHLSAWKDIPCFKDFIVELEICIQQKLFVFILNAHVVLSNYPLRVRIESVCSKDRMVCTFLFIACVFSIPQASTTLEEKILRNSYFNEAILFDFLFIYLRCSKVEIYRNHVGGSYELCFLSM